MTFFCPAVDTSIWPTLWTSLWKSEDRVCPKVPPATWHVTAEGPRRGSYPEAVLVAVDIQMLYDDLGTVPDLTAAVGADRVTGPVMEQKTELLWSLRWTQHWHHSP